MKVENLWTIFIDRVLLFMVLILGWNHKHADIDGTGNVWDEPEPFMYDVLLSTHMFKK